VGHAGALPPRPDGKVSTTSSRRRRASSHRRKTGTMLPPFTRTP
jgi:hypothetical protein